MLGTWLVVGVALSLAACSPIVEAEFSDIEVTRPDISVPPAPTTGLSSVMFSFSIDSSKLGASSKPEVQQGIVSVKLHRLALTAKTGIADLSFVETLHALACVPTSKTSTVSARQVEVADYSRGARTSTGPTFEVPLPEPVDLLSLLRPTATEPRLILVIVNIGGELPTTPWTTDVSMSLAIEIRR